MDYKAVIQDDLKAGFSKVELEVLIGLPKNNLSGILKGDRKLSRKSELKIEKWQKSEKPNPLDLIVKKKNGDGRDNPFENAARGRDKNGVNNDEVKNTVDTYWEEHKNNNPEKAEFDAVYNKEILSQIAAIKSEKIPAERNTQLGRKSWDNDQRKRISELQSKLK